MFSLLPSSPAFASTIRHEVNWIGEKWRWDRQKDLPLLYCIACFLSTWIKRYSPALQDTHTHTHRCKEASWANSTALLRKSCLESDSSWWQTKSCTLYAMRASLSPWVCRSSEGSLISAKPHFSWHKHQYPLSLCWNTCKSSLSSALTIIPSGMLPAQVKGGRPLIITGFTARYLREVLFVVWSVLQGKRNHFSVLGAHEN